MVSQFKLILIYFNIEAIFSHSLKSKFIIFEISSIVFDHQNIVKFNKFIL